MRTRSMLRPNQQEAVHEGEFYPQQMLWHGMGSGKTASTLTLINDRMDRLDVYGTLIVAPLRVCQLVWEQETKKWDYLNNRFTFSLISGTPQQRHRKMRTKADIYLINYELIEWLVDELIHVYLSKGKYLPFNMLVCDEVSKLKDPDSNRHEALRKLLAFIPYRIGLTGTPASNGYIDLFGQYLIIDSGQRLGTRVTDYREEFFSQDGYSYKITDGNKEQIKERIGDITHQYAPVRKAEELPIINDIWIKLPPALQEQYDAFERELFLELDGGMALEVFNQAALSMKCRQFAQGAAFLSAESDEWEWVHDEKMKALDEVIEEAAGEPLLIIYQFRHDRERIMKRYPAARYFGGALSQTESVQIMADWQAGKIPFLLGHPRSLGYGTEGLQYGGYIQCWFGVTWPLDDYEQTIARLDRDGQKQRVLVQRLLVLGTVEEIMKDRIEFKAETQDELKSTINNYRRRKGV